MPSFTNTSSRMVLWTAAPGVVIQVGAGATASYPSAGITLGSGGQDVIADTTVHSNGGAGYFEFAAGPGGCLLSGVTLATNSSGANTLSGLTFAAGQGLVLQMNTIQLSSGMIVAYKN